VKKNGSPLSNADVPAVRYSSPGSSLEAKYIRMHG